MAKNKKQVVYREDQVQKFIQETMKELLMFYDPSINITAMDQQVDILTEKIKTLETKKDQIKSKSQCENPFRVVIPKNTNGNIDVEISAITPTNEVASCLIHIPNSFLLHKKGNPYTIGANLFMIKKIPNYSISVDNTTDQDVIRCLIDIGSIPFQNITVTILSSDRECCFLDESHPKHHIIFTADHKVTVASEPPTGREEIPHPELLVRSHVIKWIEPIKRSDFTMLEYLKKTSDDTLYTVRDDDKTDNLTFHFDSLAEARQVLAGIYPSMKHLWNLVHIEFSDKVTDISGLFSNVLEGNKKFSDTWPKMPEFSHTVKSIKGKGITKAEDLYRDQKIMEISPDLFADLPNLENLDFAFAGIKTFMKEAPKDLLDKNKKLKTAIAMFIDTNLREDPEYWRKQNVFEKYPNFFGYMNDTKAESRTDIDIPFPWAAQAGYNPKRFTFVNVQQWKDIGTTVLENYYDFNEIDMPDNFSTNFTGLEIVIEQGNLDEMFKGTSITRLPDRIIAPNAETAYEFAAYVSTLKSDNQFPRVFEKCPKLKDITRAFIGCTGLRKVGDFIGASDTIQVYTEVFKDCTNINADTLAKPWSYAGLDGYPLDIVGYNGYLNIPNLPDDVPKEWGGKGIGTKLLAVRSAAPTLEYCFIGDDFVTFDIPEPHRAVGGIFDISMVSPDDKVEELFPNMRQKFTITDETPGMKFMMGISRFCDHTNLKADDCIRVRYLEPHIPGKPQKVWSDYVYQTPVKKIIIPSAENKANVLSFVSWKENE